MYNRGLSRSNQWVTLNSRIVCINLEKSPVHDILSRLPWAKPASKLETSEVLLDAGEDFVQWNLAAIVERRCL